MKVRRKSLKTPNSANKKRTFRVGQIVYIRGKVVTVDDNYLPGFPISVSVCDYENYHHVFTKEGKSDDTYTTSKRVLFHKDEIK